MSFEAAVSNLSTVSEKLESLRRAALSNLPVVRAAAFNILADVVNGIRGVAELAKDVELASGLAGAGVKKVCGNWVIAKDGEKVTILKLKPFRSLMFSAKDGSVAVANDVIRVEVSLSGIKIRFRGKDLEVEPLDLETINSKVPEIKSLARYMFEVINELDATLSICRKSLAMGI